MTGGWLSVKLQPPPENEVVEVQNNGGAKLKKRGNLWWFPDDSMYVYYIPEYWRPIKGF
jgi:hypothetical protein